MCVVTGEGGEETRNVEEISEEEGVVWMSVAP